MLKIVFESVQQKYLEKASCGFCPQKKSRNPHALYPSGVTEPGPTRAGARATQLLLFLFLYIFNTHLFCHLNS